jgi:hypothetical protein
VQQKKCLFCPTTKLSREHLWPHWICELFPRADYAHDITERSENRKHHKIQNSLTKRFPCVCEKCNNGWMSDVEQLAIPVLRPMILGNHPKQLRTHDQYVLATWLSLRFIIFDAYSAASIEREYFSSDERSCFAQHSDKPLLGSRVWLAVMASDWQGAAYLTQAAVRPDKNIAAQISTCVIGHVVLQMFVAKGDWESNFINQDNPYFNPKKLLVPPWSHFASQIWPYRFVKTWPPSKKFSDAEFDAFSRRIRFD